MTNHTLVERLERRAGPGGSLLRGLYPGALYNPDGPEAAARIRVLEEALRPFADAARAFRADDADTMRPAAVQAIHFRTALAALTPCKHGGR